MGSEQTLELDKLYAEANRDKNRGRDHHADDSLFCQRQYGSRGERQQTSDHADSNCRAIALKCSLRADANRLDRASKNQNACNTETPEAFKAEPGIRRCDAGGRGRCESPRNKSDRCALQNVNAHGAAYRTKEPCLI